ncbi:hypothetical protein CDV31_016508 [Fusarium ambrosium]|uniref:NB-ARC domain-containing protein n=1 Tax=Fusarium ambrosium TaxID=131363 RepID=A0A428S7C9_9HYPO|nr:hypothetical protein CDV31_016508 [Fusarium ambrosium]
MCSTSKNGTEHRAKSVQGNWMIPFERNEAFVGREGILHLLLDRIPPSTSNDACQRTVIEGLGGVGKTQIALEAAFRLRDTDSSCSVFWVPAVDATTFENSYHDIGRLLGVTRIDEDRTDVKTLVKAALSHEDAGRMKGSALLTTRTREVTGRFDVHPAGVIKMAKMSREEATEMLPARLTEGQMRDVASTDGPLDFLDNLPLAIRQASAYMLKTGMLAAAYLKHCRSSDARLVKLLSRDFEDRGRYDAIKNPVATTWLISFEHVSRDSPQAIKYLQFMCFLVQRDIPMSLLPSAEDELEADEAVGILEALEDRPQGTEMSGLAAVDDMVRCFESFA